jgi:CTP synthase (UTP-ammonia lyase)
VGGYLRNRYEILRQKALKAADKVKKTNHEVTLEPMHAAERRIVHMALAETDGISTYTVGDIEGLPFLEAIRQMRLEQGYENTLYVHVALVPILGVTGEMKTKPLQHSVNELRRIGIQPDIIVARSPTMIDAETAPLVDRSWVFVAAMTAFSKPGL